MPIKTNLGQSGVRVTWGGVDPLLVAADVNMIVSGGVFGAIGFHAHHSHEE